MSLMPHILCPRCGAKVTLPWYWIAGIEAIFRCRTCSLPLKTGYKVGALLSALSLALSIILCQLLVWLLSPYTLLLAAVLVLPLWLFLSFHLRRGYLMLRAKRYAKANPLPLESELATTPEGIDPQEEGTTLNSELPQPQETESETPKQQPPTPPLPTLPKRGSLPRDVEFEQ